jgi:hypothetical protein
MIRQLARIGAKGITNNQGQTIYSSDLNLNQNDKKIKSPNINNNKEKNQTKNITIVVDPNTNWGDLKNKISNNRGLINLSLGSPANKSVECIVDIKSFDQGMKTKTFKVSLSPKYTPYFSIIKHINSKYNIKQDLIVPKNKQLNNKNLSEAIIGYKTFYDTIQIPSSKN